MVPATDHFAVLGFERRVSLEVEAVRARFHERGRDVHPDAAGGDAPGFAALNEAQSVLSRPAARLRHLIELEWGAAAIERLRAGSMSMVLMEWFADVGAVLSRADAYIARKGRTSSALSRALLAGEEVEVQRELVAAGATLTRLRRGIEDRFPSIDEAVSEGCGEADAVEACRELSYLEKWQSQVQERMAALL